jgi:chemotaxis protein CheD
VSTLHRAPQGGGGWHAPAMIVQVLHPGDVACAERGNRLETLLGSCVAIVLADPRRTIGAMCHIVHSGHAVGTPHASSAHADVALPAMYGLLRARGINPRLCEAYVYGGGNMFPGQYARTHVGDQNARWALDALDADGVRVLLHDLGGNICRRLGWTVGHDAPEVIAVPI